LLQDLNDRLVVFVDVLEESFGFFLLLLIGFACRGVAAVAGRCRLLEFRLALGIRALRAERRQPLVAVLEDMFA